MDEVDSGASIISSRQRRSNAGNRLAALLALSEPLEDDQGIFQEVADDEEFELPSEPEEDVVDAEADENEGSQDEADADPDADENFSDSSDDSVENDEEDEDAGEKRLQKQQRDDLKAKRRAQREKMLKIKPQKRVGFANTEEAAPEHKTTTASARRRSANRVELLLSTNRRVSKRASAVRNKELIIEKLKADEQRRSEYVAPVVKEKKRLTQEERLEEAKRTELKNIASLNNFARVEEHRKQQQRLAMLSRRPKLTEFIRWQSSSSIAYPVIEVFKEETAEEKAEKERAELAEQEAEARAEAEAQAEEEARAKQAEQTEQTKQAEQDATEDAGKHETKDGENSEPAEGAETLDPSNTDAAKSEADERQPDSPVSDVDAAAETPIETPSPQTPEEEEHEEIREVAGPPRRFNASFVTFHRFAAPINNRYAVKRTLLGTAALRAQVPSARRLCVITGKLAKYVDPSSNIAYTSLDAYKIIKSIGNHSYAWSSALGGVYSHSRQHARHARGVPEGFE